MAAVFKIPNGGLVAQLDALILELIGPGSVGLFVNDYTPVAGSNVASFTEASWSGYARETAVSWTSAAITSDIAYTDSGTLTFTVTSGGTGTNCYGYFVADLGNTICLFAERFDTPIAVVDGVDIVVTIRYRQRNP